MKTKLTFFLLILVSFFGSAQSFLWADGLGGTGTDQANAVATDAAGNVYSTGYYNGTADFDPGTGVFNLTGGGVFVSKLSATGNFIWAKRLGSSGDNGFGIAVGSSGNVYITGNFFNGGDFDPGAGTFLLNSNGNSDAFISKLDASGNFVWAKNLGGNGTEIGYGLALDASENVYTTGNLGSTNADFDPGVGTFTLNSLGGNDIYVSKLNSSGAFVFAKSMGGSGNDYGFAISIDGSGNVLSTGQFGGTADLDPGASTYTLTGSGGSVDIYVSKLDASGTFIWAQQMGGSGNELAYAITTDASGNVYSTGRFPSAGDYDPGAGVFTLSGSGAYVSKLDISGNFLWAAKLGNFGDQGRAIAVDASSNVYTTGGYVNPGGDFDPGVGTYTLAGTSDVFISKLDASGAFVSAASVGGSGSDIAFGLCLDPSGNITMAGYFSAAADFDPTGGIFTVTPAGSFDAFVLKLGNIATRINEKNNFLTTEMSIYPNPSSGKFSLCLNSELGNDATITIYDVVGKVVAERKLQSGIRLLDLNMEIKGMYFVTVESEGKQMIKKLIVE
jgi:hypothetical protein